MADPREDILARLLAIARVEGVAYTARNDINISDWRYPAVSVMEGDEEAHETDPDRRPPTAPRRVTMMPQLVIISQDNPEGLGSGLNELRARLIKAVLEDEELRDLTHDGVGIRYLGMESTLAAGRSLQGIMVCKFGLTYVLKPTDL
jgi:hypothetical protein